MSEEPVTDDQSHYEVSLTAGQAFFAFVLLLLSLAASFAFGLMIGRSQGDERLLAQSSPALTDEAGVAPKKPRQRIVELGMSEDASFREPAAKPETKAPPAKAAPPIAIKEEAQPEKPRPAAVKAPEPAPGPAIPHYAQLLSTTDQKRAETFAAKLIDGGFLSAYVERTFNENGPLFRVRVNFPTEQAARIAESKLKAFGTDVWIAKQ